MSYVVTLRRIADGQMSEAELPFEWEDADGADTFWWEDGNFACDCCRAGLANDPDDSCGNERYAVRITLPDGSVPYDEIALIESRADG